MEEQEKTIEQRIREALLYHQQRVASLLDAIGYIEQNRKGAEALLKWLTEAHDYRNGIGRY